MVSVATTHFRALRRNLERCDETLKGRDEKPQGCDEKMERGAGNIKRRDRLAHQALTEALCQGALSLSNTVGKIEK